MITIQAEVKEVANGLKSLENVFDETVKPGRNFTPKTVARLSKPQCNKPFYWN
jgi:hypothetical protein